MVLPHANGSIETDEIRIETGIFQGDTFSPLLFCLAINPLSNILKRAKLGFKTLATSVSHLLYMDDLKAFTKNKEDMTRCKQLIKQFSEDIKMSFGIEKCAVMHIEKGKVIDSPLLSDIPTLDIEDSYKYLGVVEASDILHDEVKTKTTKEFIRRTRAILKSHLTASNTTQAINGFALPILRYVFGIIRWTKTELMKLDRKVRKLLTVNKFHHPKSNTHRLYISRKEGGRGVTSVLDCYEQECSSIAKYLEENEKEGSVDPLKVTIKELEKRKPPTTSLLRFLDKDRYATPAISTKRHLQELHAMPMHGQWFRQRKEIATVDIEHSNHWLKYSHIRQETESLLCAAQEQALATNYVRNKLWKMNCSSKCRLCKVHDETVNHIISGCTMMAGTKYTARHDKICTYVHWCALKERGFKTCDQWYAHVPERSVEHENIVVMWDLPMITDTHTPANRPDIVIHDRTKKEALLIDISVPVDTNIVQKTAEKHTKYRDLEIELQKCWALKKIETIPIVLGALGTVCTGHHKYLRKISPQANFGIIQKTALLGTAHILRNFLGKSSNTEN